MMPKDPIKAEEARKKISIAAKKRFENPEERKKQSERMKNISDITRQRMSESAKKRPFAMVEWNKTHDQWTPEQREKARQRRLGKRASEETKRKMSEARKGIPFTESHIQALRIANLGEKNPQFGKKASPETRKKLSECRRLEKHPNWNGGSSFEPYCVKFNKEFKERVRAFFNYQCVECGSPQNGTSLAVHHVNFDKQSCCNDSIPLFVSLCHSCHAKTNHITKEKRQYWKQHFTDIINQYYGGRCYFMKNEIAQIKPVLAGGD